MWKRLTLSRLLMVQLVYLAACIGIFYQFKHAHSDTKSALSIAIYISLLLLLVVSLLKILPAYIKLMFHKPPSDKKPT